MELHIRAVSARYLLDKQTFGRQDPYCILRLRGKTSKTRVHDNGDRTPVWNEKFIFEVYDLQQDQLHVEVKDKNFVSSALIGELHLPVSQFSHGNVVDMWFKLTNGGREAGEINLRVQLLGAHSGKTMQASAYPVATAAPGYPQAQQSQQQPAYAQPPQQQQPVYPPQQQQPIYAQPPPQQPVYAQPPPQQPVYAQPPPQPVYAQPPQQVRYAQPPVVVAPPPVVMAPPPVVMAPPPVVMAPPPVVMAPQTVVMGAPVVYGHDYYHHHHHHGYHHDYDGGMSAGAGLALGVGAGVIGGLMLEEALDDGGSFFD